jgi:hypothetical protein
MEPGSMLPLQQGGIGAGRYWPCVNKVLLVLSMLEIERCLLARLCPFQGQNFQVGLSLSLCV